MSIKLTNLGFTLIELIVVMILTGILAVTVLPRFAGLKTIDDRGFHDTTLAALRYAQKAAIAQRRTVCLSFTPNSLSARIATAAPPSATCDSNLSGPNGTSPYTVTARGASAYSTTPTAFSFSASGAASMTQTIQVANLSRSITIEAETGYVHD